MSKHVYFNTFPGGIKYECEIWAAGFDVLAVTVKKQGDSETYAKTYEIPVKQKYGFAWKCYKHYVANSSGNAHDLIRLFAEFSAYASKTVDHICFNGAAMK